MRTALLIAALAAFLAIRKASGADEEGFSDRVRQDLDTQDPTKMILVPRGLVDSGLIFVIPAWVWSAPVTVVSELNHLAAFANDLHLPFRYRFGELGNSVVGKTIQRPFTRLNPAVRLDPWVWGPGKLPYPVGKVLPGLDHDPEKLTDMGWEWTAPTDIRRLSEAYESISALWECSEKACGGRQNLVGEELSRPDGPRTREQLEKAYRGLPVVWGTDLGISIWPRLEWRSRSEKGAWATMLPHWWASGAFGNDGSGVSFQHKAMVGTLVPSSYDFPAIGKAIGKLEGRGVGPELLHLGNRVSPSFGAHWVFDDDLPKDQYQFAALACQVAGLLEQPKPGGGYHVLQGRFGWGPSHLSMFMRALEGAAVGLSMLGGPAAFAIAGSRFAASTTLRLFGGAGGSESLELKTAGLWSESMEPVAIPESALGSAVDDAFIPERWLGTRIGNLWRQPPGGVIPGQDGSSLQAYIVAKEKLDTTTALSGSILFAQRRF